MFEITPEMINKLDYFYSYLKPIARSSMTKTPKGFYACSLNEKELYHIFDVYCNSDLNEYLFHAEFLGAVKIDVHVGVDETVYDFYVTDKGMKYV